MVVMKLKSVRIRYDVDKKCKKKMKTEYKRLKVAHKTSKVGAIVG